MRGRWDAKSNPWDYGIARNFGSGLRDRKTLLGTLHVKFWMNKCITFTPLGFCFVCIFIVTVFSYHRASVFNLKIQRIIQCQTKCHSHLTLMLNFRTPVLSGQPLLSGHLAIARG